MHSSDASFGSSSSDSDDEEGGWLSHSQFTLGPAPPVSVSARHLGMDGMSGERRPLGSTGPGFVVGISPKMTFLLMMGAFFFFKGHV